MPETVEHDEYRIELEPSQGGWAWELRLFDPYRYPLLTERSAHWSYVKSHWAYTRWGALYAAKKAARQHTKTHLQPGPRQKTEEVFFALSRTPHPKERP